MTRQEIKRHARKIAALRGWQPHGQDYDEKRRRTVSSGVTRDAVPVDQMFAARVERGWLPRRGASE